MDKTYEELFAERLAKLRIQKGVSAREMSFALGQNGNYISHIENRSMLPSMFAFFNICDYLKITPQVFFEFDNIVPDTYEHITSNLKKLNEQQIKSLDLIIDSMAK